LRTAGVIELAVIEPPEGGPGSHEVSPIRTVMSFGFRPSSSATTWAIRVLVPVPMSCTAESASTEPSFVIRTSQPESMLTIRYQTDWATPTPRLTGPRSEAGLRRLPAQPKASAPSLRSARREGNGSLRSRRASGSRPSFSASSSIACSRAKQPWGWPGARMAAPGPALTNTSYCSRCRFGQRYMASAGPPTPAPVPTPAVP
jgi:hypothetical protein